MTLQDELDALRARRATSPALHTAYLLSVAELRRTRFLGRAIRTGAAFPEFLLPDTAGRLVSLRDLSERGPLVITFFRGQWCPYCALTLAGLEAALPEINAAGGGLVAFTPETGGLALATKQQHGLRYDVLVDVDSGVGLQCGVVFRTPEPYRDLLASFGIDLPQRQDIGGWLLPAPVAYIVDRGGIIRWDFLDVDFTRRAEPADIVRALHAIR